LEPIDGDWNVMKPQDARPLLPPRIPVIENISEVLAIAE
jgi:hypothetical protein